MNRLRQKVHPDCPAIFGSTWERDHEHGWRWACNLSLTDNTGEQILTEYQTAHGKKNITIGWPFDENEFEPKSIPNLCGLYIRDVEKLVRDLNEALDNDKKVEEWLTKTP